MDARLLLCAELNTALHQRLHQGLSACGYRVLGSPTLLKQFVGNSLSGADAAIVAGAPDDAFPAIERIRKHGICIPIVFITRRSTEAEAVASVRAGVTDYLEESVSIGHLDVTIRLRLRATRRRHVSEDHCSAPACRRLLGVSAVMHEIRAATTQVATVDSNVLITGETGTGKELVAESIHEQSPRRDRPFVRVNCAAIPDTLVESELFGHERGAFTGADSVRDGLVARAQGGTIFFDEIGEMSPAAQAKILRAIESKEIYRLGSKHCTSLNVRIIAATNRDIEQVVAAGHFRSDLYFRLNVARICLPPLRERKEDIPLLCQHFIEDFNQRLRCGVTGMSDDVLGRLLRYDWPGNVRELRNVIEGTFLKARSGCIALGSLSDLFLRRLQGPPSDERERLLEILFSTNWNKSRAAEQLRWSRMTLYRRMAKYKIAQRLAAASRRPVL